MRKIGIVTLNGYHNYGNRLQNYAVQEVLKSLGFSVETIVIIKKEQNIYNQSNSLKNKLSNINFEKILSKIMTIINKDAICVRTGIFKDFTAKYILENDYDFSDNSLLCNLTNKFDYFITGSDQVWNPMYINKLPEYFLTFVPKEKRIAYSASFGVSEIPYEYVDKYKIWISDMHKLSVREDSGANIIKTLTGKDAAILVDPTLMLSKEQWISISKESINKPKCKYLLTYFLGNISKETKINIKLISQKYKLKIVNLVNLKDLETYQTGPSEFIDYINSCSILCTDSFHGAVFSILMEKPFIIYERVDSSISMYSRINTLLDKFHLNSRKASNIKTAEQAFNVDYSHIVPILEAERQKSFNYLKDALNIQDEV